jgi:hypothetical protein
VGAVGGLFLSWWITVVLTLIAVAVLVAGRRER